MADSQNYLAMVLDAPLQSWGHMSRFDRRMSLSYPTCSGIIGLLCAAMGVDRFDTEGLAAFKYLKISVFPFQQGSRMIDYHTVGGGYDNKFKKQNIVPKANGSPGDPVQTYREYLEDYRFGIILQDTSERLTEIGEALQNPRWGIWLGRKACVPARPVFHGVHCSLEEALVHMADCLNISRPGSCIFEVPKFSDGNDTINDVPLDFSKREFAPRRVKIEPY